MRKFHIPWRSSPEERARDREDEIHVSLGERIHGSWARFHERLPWRRLDLALERARDLDDLPRQPRNWKRWIGMGAGVLAVLAALIAILGPKINERLQDRTLRQAREFLRVQDYQRAQLMLEQAVQVNPADSEARRELARFYEEAGAPRAIQAWKDLGELNPNSDDDHMSLAHCALIFGEMETVTKALALVSEAGRGTAQYHQLMAAVDLKKGNQQALNEEIATLAKLEPGDARSQFNWAVVRLGSLDPATRAKAQTELEQLARGDKMRIRAMLELIPVAIRQSSATAYTRLAEVILGPSRGFVTALGAAPRGLFDLVQHMENQPNPTAEDAGALGEWLVRQGYPADAVLWLDTLKPELKDDRTVMAADAFALARIHDWPGVEKELKAGAWGKVPEEIVTLAFAARVQHVRGLTDHAKATWEDAVEMAPTTEALRVLLRLSNELGWTDESIKVLWQLTRAAPADSSNWRSLAATVSALHPSEELLQVYLHWSKSDPADPIPHGQLRWIQTLLGHGPPTDPPSTEMAYPALCAARALELDETGRAPAALVVLNGVPDGAKTDWRVALARGLTLAILGHPDESEDALGLAASAPLIAEEKKLMERARTINSAASPGR